jgi:16S rRNA (cytosine967-C5)-methyltransferase
MPAYRRPRRPGRTGPAAASKRGTGRDTGVGSARENTARGNAAREDAARGNAARGNAAREDAARRDTARRSSLPRRTAYDVLAAVAHREAYANLLLPRLIAERGLSGRDAALATELAYGTLRGQGTYDAVLAACSDRPLDKLDPPVLLVLRLGAHQLLNTRVGAYAAVATSVDLAKAVAGPRVSGYVNAVLRRVSTRDLDAWLDLLDPPGTADPDSRLALRYSHPAWIVAAYRDALGDAADEELEAALAAGNARPRVTLAAFPGGRPREELMPAGAEPGHWSQYAFTLSSGDPAGLVASGEAAVQDEGSQLAAIALARAPLVRDPAAPGASGSQPELWLDMCAGPGGKSRLLAGLASPAGARLTAAEIHPHRAALVEQNLARASASVVVPPRYQVLVADGLRPPWRSVPDGGFDRVLVDVPCSGLGALRRRPEARWRKSAADIPALAGLQRALLRSALGAVRPGGVVAYVTCSPVPAETSDVVTDVVRDSDDVEVLDAPAVLSGVPALRSADPLFAQLWPHRHGTDAIFIALLRRR